MDKPSGLRSFLIGETSLLIRCGEILLEGDFKICGVISSNSTIQNWAKDKKIRFLGTKKEILPFLKKETFDYLFSIANYMVLPAEALDLPLKYTINYHDAPLPKYAGVHATSWAIMNQERYHAVSWHLAGEMVDAGDILKQFPVEISEKETAFSLNVKCYDAAIKMFHELIDELAHGKEILVRQNLEERTYFPLYKRPAAAGVISFESDARQIDAQVRALGFGNYPNALGLTKFEIGNDFLVIAEMEVLEWMSSTKPGTLNKIDEDFIDVSSLTNQIRLKSIFTLDGKRIPIKEFVERYDLREGSLFRKLEKEVSKTITVLNNAFCRFESYWVKELSQMTPVTLPYFESMDGKGKAENFATISLPEEFHQFLLDHADLKQEELILAAFIIYLMRLTGMNSFCIGFSGSSFPEEIHGLESLFSANVPFNIELDDDDGLQKVLVIVKKFLSNLLKHKTFIRDVFSRYPALNFIKEHNIFPVRVQIVEVAEEKQEISDEQLTLIIPSKGKECLLRYSAQLDRDGTIEPIQTHLLNILRNPDQKISQIQLLTEAEKAKLVEWNQTQTDAPKEQTIVNLFERQVEKTPDNVAVVFNGADHPKGPVDWDAEPQQLSYRGLDRKANQLAHYLLNLKTDTGHCVLNTENCLVAICVERSFDMLIGLLGVLKAGGAYVPLDPHYPEERLGYILKDSQAQLILTQSQLKDKVFSLFNTVNRPGSAQSRPAVLLLDEEWPDIDKKSTKGRRRRKKGQGRDSWATCQTSALPSPNDIAYVIYTSGSTGNPKGVMIPHQALTNFLISMGNQPGLQIEDKMLAVTTYCFDIAGLELYLPLIKGAQCHLCDAGTTKDPQRLKKLISRIKPTVMQATPSAWSMLFHVGWQNEENVKILCGGEALPESLKEHFIRTNSDAWNLYGPTETTIWSTLDQIKKERPLTIGKPIANTEIHILDNKNRLTPIGVTGKLCIAGDGLAKGYWDQPELTAEKFFENPFHSGRKLYQTGDLARWLPDGTIQYLGRMDFQVKIRGFRIELGEIESQLNIHPQIKESAVIVKEEERSKQLIAYYVPSRECERGAEGSRSQSEELKIYLKAKLPDYMIPEFLIALDKLPLTANGKMNRNALANREIVLRSDGNGGAGHTSPKKVQNSLPQSEIEKEVLAIWKSILKIEDIRVTDGFFEVGGNSLSAVILTERISKTFHLSFTVTTLFKYSNIRQISEYVNQMDQNVLSLKEKREETTRSNVNHKPSVKNGVSSLQIGNRKDSPKPYPEYYKDSLAIIGMSCHFPGAKDYREFWQNLIEGKESANFFSREELREIKVPEEMIQNPNYVPMQLAIEGKDLFDREFFNLSPRNTTFMDPQFRLLLLHSWQAIEDAGYVSKEIPETSVFMSVANNYYQTLLQNSAMVEGSDKFAA